MLLALIRLGLFEPIIVSGTFTCTGSDWVLDGSKCYKTINGSPLDGQIRCSIEDHNAILMLAPTSTVATRVDTLFSGEKIWVGLRFRNGAEWFWDNGSNEPVTWGSTPILPQLCIGLWPDGSLFDYDCFHSIGLICQKDLDIDVADPCEPTWTRFGVYCFKRLKQTNPGVSFSDGRTLCSHENALVMMPHSQSEAEKITITLDCGEHCWVGVTDFDVDHIYTWEDGTYISQSSLYFNTNNKVKEPNNRDKDYICAYIHNGEFYNHACTTSERVICEIDALDNSQTTVSIQKSTQTESTSAEIQITTYTSAFKTTPTILAKTSKQLESTSDKTRTTDETSAIKTTPTTAVDNSQTTVSTKMSTQTESTSAEMQITTYTSVFKTTPTTIPTKTSKQLESTSDKIQTTVQTSKIKTNPTKGTKASTPYDVNIASGTSSTGPNRSADETVTTVNKPVVQYDNATIMPSTFLGHTTSASDVPCIIQCISKPSEKLNTNNDVRPINIPYKVDLKSLSSYRRRHKSADDPRMSSFYIGCVGIAVLVMSILFIIMLDCLPSA